MNKGTNIGRRPHDSPAPATRRFCRSVPLWLLSVGLLASLALLGGCSSSSDDGVTGPGPATFKPSSPSSGAGFVRLGGEAIADDRVRVDIQIGGATTDLDLYAFAFDIELGDPTLIAYIVGSATFGDALVVDASDGQGKVDPPLVSQQGSRVVVGVTKTGGTPGSAGNDIPAGESTIVSLDFRINAAGTSTLSFLGSPANPENPTNDPAGLDSNGGVVAGVVFDDKAALISR